MVSHTKLRYVVDDIAKDLKQVFDDRVIERSQIAYWVLLVGNRLKSQHIGKINSGAYVHAFANIPVQIAATGNNPNDIAGRKRILLPEAIYDYDKDGGIEYISYWDQDAVSIDCIDPPEFTNRTFQRTRPIFTERLYMDKYERPSPKNPYFYRQGKYIYFLGIECVDVLTVEIGIYSTFDPLTVIDLDAEFEFPEELLLILKRQVLDLGRFALKIPEDRKNDGEDTTDVSSVSEQKLVSVNDPINQQQQVQQ
jgi:hypothetical protein